MHPRRRRRCPKHLLIAVLAAGRRRKRRPRVITMAVPPLTARRTSGSNRPAIDHRRRGLKPHSNGALFVVGPNRRAEDEDEPAS